MTAKTFLYVGDFAILEKAPAFLRVYVDMRWNRFRGYLAVAAFYACRVTGTNINRFSKISDLSNQ